VLVIYGSSSGLTATGVRRIRQEDLDMSEARDHFGASLAQ
jgi:hypothetical protein